MNTHRQQRSGGIDFTAHMRRLCADFVIRLNELSHIDLARVAISFSQTRKRVSHGLWASLTPLRFEGGSHITVRGGRTWTVQQISGRDGREMLYLLNFYLPRFLDQSLDEKLNTVVHELWHIGPRFDGDLRRHQGRCYMHGNSQREYDQAMEKMVQKWRSLDPPAEVFAFLQSDFNTLQRRWGGVRGTKIPSPKLIPLNKSAG